MEADVLGRYSQKIKDYFGGIDSYTQKSSKDPWPCNVHHFDICNYCIDKDSSYTLQSFKAYKSLEAFKLYEGGWTKHSCRVHLTPLKCWVSVDNDGIVLCWHCDCMAGLAEVCSHVAAVLFLLEDWGRKSKDLLNSAGITCSIVGL